MAEDFLQMVHKSVRFNKKRYGNHVELFSNQSREQHTNKKNRISFFEAPVDDDDNENSNISGKDLRKMHSIHVKGSDVVLPVGTFDEMVSVVGVPQYIIDNVRALPPNGLGFTVPTPIQMQIVPLMVSRREVMACAPTGSGKTAAFLIPLFALLGKPKKRAIRAVILSPTKELADQIYRQAKQLAEGTRWRLEQLTKANAHKNTFVSVDGKHVPRDMLVSTPMRLVHAIETDIVDLSNVRHLVLDEADRLFDDGFIGQVDKIMAACSHKKLRTSMFSATLYQGVEMLARSVLRDPVRVTIGARNAASHDVSQRLVFVGQEDGKLLAFRQLLQKGLKPPVLVFVQSKTRATQLFHELVYDDVNVDVIHSERTPGQRATIIKKFRGGSIWVLICTDLMARGIDFKGVNCVINYDFPQSSVQYVHRIGRTGRAGRSGESVTFFTESDVVYLRSIVNVMRESGCDVPQWMVDMNQPSARKLKQLKDHALPRQSVAANERGKHKSNKKRKRPRKDGE